MYRRWLGCLIALFGATTVGYTVSIVAATPEDMIRRPFSCSDPSHTEPKAFKVLSVRKWSQGIVALYSGKCPGEKASQSVLSYRVVKRRGMEWLLAGTGTHPIKESKNATSNDKKLIDYGVGQTLSKAKERHAVFYGQVLAPNVAAVEVTFNNGKVLRDRGLDQKFLLVAPGATGICDVRVLGVDNQILHREELVSRNAAIAGNTCQPISGQL
jgi:hypothetical protein